MAYTKTMDDTEVTMDAVDVTMDGWYPAMLILEGLAEPRSIPYPTAKEEPYQRGKSISYPSPKSVYSNIKQ